MMKIQVKLKGKVVDEFKTLEECLIIWNPTGAVKYGYSFVIKEAK